MKHIQLISNVRNTARRYQMIAPNDSVLVCVSGGPDSVFLLKALLYLKKEFNLSLSVAHLDHGLRGVESRGDAQFVRKLAKEHNLPFYLKNIRLKRCKGLSTEEAARAVRYEFFRYASKKAGASKIATAHNTDDQAETVLMRIIKGTSLNGLAGIPPVREEGASAYIRPLFETEKKDILKFLSDNKIAYRIDRTNKENIYFRNVIRNEVLPYLERFNPRIRQALCGLGENIAEAKAFLDESKFLRRSGISSGNDGQGLDIKHLITYPSALRKEILKDTLLLCGVHMKKLTSIHWKEITRLIESMPNNKTLQLPGKVEVKKIGNRLYFYGSSTD